MMGADNIDRNSQAASLVQVSGRIPSQIKDTMPNIGIALKDDINSLPLSSNSTFIAQSVNMDLSPLNIFLLSTGMMLGVVSRGH